MKKLILPLLFLALATSCTKKSDSGEGSAGAATQTTINLGTVGETMAFDQTELTVPSGKDITLTLKNNSTTLQHNWVLTQPGKDNDVSMAGLKAGAAKGFIPDDPAVIAHTKLLDAGTSDTVTFKAPPPGDYPYICTNAGHSVIMKGVLHSK